MPRSLCVCSNHDLAAGHNGARTRPVDELTALLGELVASGAALGRVEQLTLDARRDNGTAHALWQSRGFVQYGRLADFVAVGETRYDKTLWVLDLRGS